MAQINRTRPRSAAGAITAPARAAKSRTTGLAGNHIAYRPPGYTAPKPQAPHPSPAAIRAQQDQAAPRAGAQPSAPPAPYTGAPWNAAYESTVAGANAKYDAALQNLGYRRTAEQQEFGLDPGFNDYKANPYSRAALLEQSFQRANRATGTSLAAAGQLYSGASQNAETYNREHNAQERNALESTYRKALQGIGEEEAGALATREEEKANALWRSIEAASNAELEPEAAPAGGGGNGRGGTPRRQGGGVIKTVVHTQKNGKKKKTKIGIGGARKA